MTYRTFTSREFNQDSSGAKRASLEGPVFITDRGRPAHVLLTIEEYHRLSAGAATIIDMLAMSGAQDIDFEPPRATGFAKSVDLS